MKSLDSAIAQSTEKTTLNGLPRRRPPGPPAESERGIQALRELHRLTPPVNLVPGTEAAFLETDGLMQFKCLQWVHVAKQFYEYSPRTRSDSPPLRNLPPISFLNLLIDWIDEHAKITGRKKTRGPTWRWRALQGFVHDNRRLQSGKFLINVERVARSIAAHFLNPPFDSQLLVLWGDWHRWRHATEARRSSSASTPADVIKRGLLADRVFTVLRRFRSGGKVSADDYQTLEPFLPKAFELPFFIDPIHDQRERKSLSQFIARAATLDVYSQHRDMIGGTSSLRDYVEQVSAWAMKLCDDEIRSKFELIHWRFCGYPSVRRHRHRKKTYAVY